jgi:hypothetical protein
MFFHPSLSFSLFLCVPYVEYMLFILLRDIVWEIKRNSRQFSIEKIEINQVSYIINFFSIFMRNISYRWVRKMNTPRSTSISWMNRNSWQKKREITKYIYRLPLSFTAKQILSWYEQLDLMLQRELQYKSLHQFSHSHLMHQYMEHWERDRVMCGKNIASTILSLWYDMCMIQHNKYNDFILIKLFP